MKVRVHLYFFDHAPPIKASPEWVPVGSKGFGRWLSAYPPQLTQLANSIHYTALLESAIVQGTFKVDCISFLRPDPPCPLPFQELEKNLDKEVAAVVRMRKAEEDAWKKQDLDSLVHLIVEGTLSLTRSSVNKRELCSQVHGQGTGRRSIRQPQPLGVAQADPDLLPAAQRQ